MSFTIEQGVDNFKRYKAILLAKKEELDERHSALDELNVEERSVHMSICVFVDEDVVKTLMKDVYDKFPSMHDEIDSQINSQIEKDVYPDSGYGVSYDYSESFYEDLKTCLSENKDSKYKKTFTEAMESSWLRPAINIIGEHCEPSNRIKNMSFDLSTIDKDDYTYENDYIKFTGLSGYENNDTIGNHQYELKENITEIENEIERIATVLDDLDTWLRDDASLEDFLNVYEDVGGLEREEMDNEQLGEIKLIEESDDALENATSDFESISREIISIEMGAIVVEKILKDHNDDANFTSYYTESYDFDEEFKSDLISHIEEEMEMLEEDDSSVIASSPSI